MHSFWTHNIDQMLVCHSGCRIILSLSLSLSLPLWSWGMLTCFIHTLYLAGYNGKFTSVKTSELLVFCINNLGLTTSHRPSLFSPSTHIPESISVMEALMQFYSKMKCFFFIILNCKQFVGSTFWYLPHFVHGLIQLISTSLLLCRFASWC